MKEEQKEKTQNQDKKEISNKKIKLNIKKEFLIAITILIITLLLVNFLFFSKARISENKKTEIPVIPYPEENTKEQENTGNPFENVNAVI
ncbi:MAG: hypothetical protein QXU20_04970 [Candidatus Woesearchaeota archaeon]